MDWTHKSWTVLNRGRGKEGCWEVRGCLLRLQDTNRGNASKYLNNIVSYIKNLILERQNKMVRN